MPIRMHRIGAIAFAFAALIAGSAAAQIKIGFSTGITGPAALGGLWERWGVDEAVAEINTAGGLLGQKVEVVLLDNRCNPTEGANTARRLVQEKVNAIIGGHCSSATLAMMPIIDEAKIPMLTGVSTTPRLTEMSGAAGNRYMFRLNPDDAMMASGLVQYLDSKKLYKSIAIIAEDSDFGRGGAQAFAPLAEKAGMKIVSTDFTPLSTPDFTPVLTRVNQRKPDAIALFMLSADQLNLLRTSMQMGLKIPYTGRAELQGRNLDVIQAGGMEGSVSAWTYSPDVPGAANQAFAKKILDKYKSTATLQAWAGYDGMRLIAQAIREGGSAEPAKIRDAMEKVKFTTLLGKQVAFDKNHQAGKVVLIQQVKDKKVVILDLWEIK